MKVKGTPRERIAPAPVRHVAVLTSARDAFQKKKHVQRTSSAPSHKLVALQRSAGRRVHLRCHYTFSKSMHLTHLTSETLLETSRVGDGFFPGTSRTDISPSTHVSATSGNNWLEIMPGDSTDRATRKCWRGTRPSTTRKC